MKRLRDSAASSSYYLFREWRLLLLPESFSGIVLAFAQRFDTSKLCPLSIALELLHESIGYVDCALGIGRAVLGNGEELGTQDVNDLHVGALVEDAEEAVLHGLRHGILFHGRTSGKGVVLEFLERDTQEESLQAGASGKSLLTNPPEVVAELDTLEARAALIGTQTYGIDIDVEALQARAATEGIVVEHLHLTAVVHLGQILAVLESRGGDVLYLRAYEHLLDVLVALELIVVDAQYLVGEAQLGFRRLELVLAMLAGVEEDVLVNLLVFFLLYSGFLRRLLVCRRSLAAAPQEANPEQETGTDDACFLHCFYFFIDSDDANIVRFCELCTICLCFFHLLAQLSAQRLVIDQHDEDGKRDGDETDGHGRGPWSRAKRMGVRVDPMNI